MDELLWFLLTCGVYDTQAAVVEFIFRFRQNFMQIYYVTRPSALGMSDPIWGPLIQSFVDEKRIEKDRIKTK